jgi:hypothetical protein
MESLIDSPGLPWYPILKDATCFKNLAGEPRYQFAVASIENRMSELRARLPGTLERFQLMGLPSK